MDFWIGDWVKDPKTGLIGKYEGKIDFQAKINVQGKFYFVKESDLTILTDAQIEKHLEKKKKSTSNKKKTAPGRKKTLNFENSLDLHIEKLAPHLVGKRAELIVVHQIQKCRSFIFEAIKRKQISITIIHGKGTGALKMEVEHLLMEFDEVYFTKSINNGGGIELMLSY